MAGTTARGSLTGHCAPLLMAGSRFLGPLYTSYPPSTSAMKMPWNFASSRSFARLTQWATELNSAEVSSGYYDVSLIIIWSYIITQIFFFEFMMYRDVKIVAYCCWPLARACTDVLLVTLPCCQRPGDWCPEHISTKALRISNFF